jgi:hypothetical protein
MFLGVRQGSINSRLILLEEVFQKGIVQELSALGLRKHCPEQKCQLEGVVEGNPVEKNVDKDFNDGKEGKDNPVNQPLSVVSLALGFDRLERLEGGVEEANNARERGNTHAKSDQDGKQKASAQNEKLLGDMSLFLLDVNVKGSMCTVVMGEIQILANNQVKRRDVWKETKLSLFTIVLIQKLRVRTHTRI